ncbi:hypothetical protein BHU72_07815 [Desulfuribacillus stibiiarsenatis]|uniref:Dihydroorotase n=1 Tax=Desulfuribacillus stibiiarsenatis TaxID=1390249 RepID=A0A1E5L3M7_9FIRM|nr:dihydroorotase [Desulfuribacillus stibiiarsenatis]OEH84732.1 hypothetical protein BHU72_07815 [Desulfuribacillus stibiiarsenatis]
MILFKNVKLFDGHSLIGERDVLIKNNKIQLIQNDIDEQSIPMDILHELKIINGNGKLLAPGFIDVHVHLREPGFEYKETIETGSLAAAKGGFTTICCMPNTNPVIDSIETVQSIKAKAAINNGVSVNCIAAITVSERGEDLTDFVALREAGIIALSDDGRGVQDAKVMQDAFMQAAELKIPVIIHAEDEPLAKGGHMHAGEKAEELGIKGIPSTSESVMVARDILLAEAANAHVHFAHLSAKESVRWIEHAKKMGINVTCEVTPQHLVMNDQDILEDHGNFKVNPPIRAREDQNQLISAFQSGIIDIIATDHAPHSEEEKSRGIKGSPFGMVGLETAFAVLYSKLVLQHKVSLERLLQAMTSRPAEIFGFKNGIIEPNGEANLVLVDLDKRKLVDANNFASKGKNSPFIGWELQGWPIMTIVSGEIIHEDKEV